MHQFQTMILLAGPHRPPSVDWPGYRRTVRRTEGLSGLLRPFSIHLSRTPVWNGLEPMVAAPSPPLRRTA
jgi:hypothetical protein